MLEPDAVSNADAYCDSHRHRNTDDPSYNHADAERLPALPSGVRNTHPAHHAYTYTNDTTYADAKSHSNGNCNSNTYACPSAGHEYLDAIAG